MIDRLVTTSDFHGHAPEVHPPDGDLLTVHGDCTDHGNQGEVEEFFNWVVHQAPRYTHGVVFIAGNHDKSFDRRRRTAFPESYHWFEATMADFLRTPNVYYLENSGVEIDGVKIWGSPYTPWFNGDKWAFNVHRGPDSYDIWQLIPEGTDILITHGPVMGKLDYFLGPMDFQLPYKGCEQLKQRVEEIKPKLHLCGHIHTAHGMTRDAHTFYLNSCMVDNSLQLAHKPLTISCKSLLTDLDSWV